MAPLGSIVPRILEQAKMSEKVSPDECKLLLKGTLMDTTIPFRFANIPSGTKLQLRTGHERVLGIQEASAAQPSSKAEGKRPRDLDMLPNQGTAAPPYSAATPNTSGTAATASKADQCGPAPSGAQAEKDRRALHVFTKQAEAELDARTMATPELDEAAYEFTEGDARKVLAGYANARRNAESRTLMTKQMREAEQERKAAAYGRVPVRVELPDGHVVQATFAAVEKLQALHSLVASVLVPEVASAFYLFTAPPKVELKDPGVSLYAAGLVPAARVHVGFRNAAALPEYKGCLNDEAMALLGDPPARAEAMGRPAKTVFEQKEGSEGDERAPANRTAGPAAEGEGRPRRPKAGMPSWMKLSSA